MRRYCLMLLLFLQSACQEAILHDLDERSANAMTVLLSKQGVKASKSREGTQWSLKVPSENVSKALSIIEEKRLFRPVSNTKESNGSGFLRSREERKFFVQRKLSASIEETLKHLPSVIEARVHISTSEKERLQYGKKGSRQSASTLLIVSSKVSVGKNEIQEIVSGATGIEKKGVSVVFAELPRSTEIEVVDGAKEEVNLLEKGETTQSEMFAKTSVFQFVGPVLLATIPCVLYFARREKGTGRKKSEHTLKPIMPNDFLKSEEESGDA